jgi:glycosyltransferase involved in cell wall biosynthesis
MYRKLVVISHTPHRMGRDGQLRGWGPTVRELDKIANVWAEVVHIGVLLRGLPEASDLPYSTQNIRFRAIPPSGGAKWFEKISIIGTTYTILKTIHSEIKDASHVQVRVPMGFGLYLIPWFGLSFHRKYCLWFKYANNWIAKSVPPGYRLQRWMLRHNWARCKVTINGHWAGQPRHCLSFENPCLTSTEIADGFVEISKKSFEKPFELVFIGRLDKEKGVPELARALQAAPDSKISRVHIIGVGPLKSSLEDIQRIKTFPILFHGWLPGGEIRSLLSSSNFLLLPSRSEGFPKVIAEAFCYGCIPVCSDVGSIPQYVDEGNGFLWKSKGLETFGDVLQMALDTRADKLSELAKNGHTLASRFSYEAYLQSLQERVFKDNRC